MNVFTTIDQLAKALGLKYLVIGGHAVNAYGYTRTTIDVDLLVCRDDKQQWQTQFESVGYKVFFDGGNFLQFTAPLGNKWPVDLMLVNQPTFSGLWEKSEERVIQSVSTRIPCVEHLIALKLHALKHGGPHRTGKDFQDVLGLIEQSQFDPYSEKVKVLFEKYGDIHWYEQALKSLGPNR